MLLRDFSVPFEHVKMIDPKFYSYSYTQPYFLPGRGSYYTTLAHIEEVKTTAFFWCAGWRQRRRLLSQSERLTYWGKERERGGREGAGREQGGSREGAALAWRSLKERMTWKLLHSWKKGDSDADAAAFPPQQQEQDMED